MVVVEEEGGRVWLGCRGQLNDKTIMWGFFSSALSIQN